MCQSKERKIAQALGFLTKEYNMQFEFQSFDRYHNFYGPMDTYSFYNDFGCITLHNAVQRGEWAVYVAKKFSNNQESLMEREIYLTNYTHRRVLTFAGWLKELTKIIEKEIWRDCSVFGIRLKRIK